MKKLICIIPICLLCMSLFAWSVTDVQVHTTNYSCTNVKADFIFLTDTMYSGCIAYWNFGDGVKATKSNTNVVSHTYTVPGKYTVKLVVKKNMDSVVIIKTDLITVRKNPVAKFSYDIPDSLLFAPVTLNFTNKSLKGDVDSIVYSWDFDDGIIQHDKNVSHTFLHPGEYYFTLTAKDSANCVSEKYASITIKDSLQIGERPFLNTGCYPQGTFPPCMALMNKYYAIYQDTVSIIGLYEGNCGSNKTATVQEKGDTILIRTWETGPFTTCSCAFCIGFNTRISRHNSAIVYFNGERLSTMFGDNDIQVKTGPSFRIYPNPCENIVFIEPSGSTLNYSILNLEGKMLLTGTCSGEILTNSLAVGVYVLQLSDSQSNFIRREILIKK